MKTYFFYGWELTLWKRRYGELEEFKAAVEELSKDGLHVIVDEAYDLLFAAVNCEVIESQEIVEFGLDDFNAVAAKAPELRAAIEKHLGKWVTLTLEPRFFIMQED